MNDDLIRDRRVCVTGRMVSMTHAELAGVVEARGGRYLPHPRRCGFWLVIGGDGWPADERGAPTTVLRRSQRLRAMGYPIEFLAEDEFLRRFGLAHSAGAIRDRHTIGDLARILDVSPVRIRRWIRADLIRPVGHRCRLATFDFRQVANAKRLCDLLESGASLSTVRRGLDRIRRWLPDEQLPLSQLARLERGELVLRCRHGLMDSRGQRMLDFDQGGQGGAVVGIPVTEAAESVEALFDEALDLEDAGRLTDAEAAYRRVLRAGPDDPVVHFNLGNVLFALGRFEESLECFASALRLDPDYAEAWNNSGIAHAELGRLERALECLRRAVRLIPSYADAHFNLADVCGRLGMPQRAAEHRAAYRRFSSAERLMPSRRPPLRVVDVPDGEDA